MSVLGDKIVATILAQTTKVPSIPESGSTIDGEDESRPGFDKGMILDDFSDWAFDVGGGKVVKTAVKIGCKGGLKAARRASARENKCQTHFPQLTSTHRSCPIP
jgi:biotin carboxylase